MAHQKKLLSVIAGLLLSIVATPSLATVILEDDFSGAAGPVNAVKWTTTGNAALNGSGQVVLDATAGGVNQILAVGGGGGTYGFQPSGGQHGKLTATAGPISGPGGFTVFGLTTDGSGTNEITLRVAHGASWNLSIFSNGGNDGGFYFPGVAQGDVGTWELEWHPGRVLLYFEDELKIDTDVDSPSQSFGAGPILPTTNLAPYAAKTNEFAFTVDSITWEAIPEPSTAAILAVGALVGLSRRFVGGRLTA